MKKSAKPTIAGILNITTGVISVISVIGLTIALAATSIWTVFLDLIPVDELPFVASILSTVLIILIVLSIIETVFPIMGGLFAIQRKRWGWTLYGSIIAALAVFPLGIAAIILVVLSKDEFTQQAQTE